MRTRQLVVTIAAVALLCPLSALAGGGKLPKSDQRAIEIYNRAAQAVAQVPECRGEEPEPTTTHDAPSTALLDTVGVLRRPATQEDSAFPDELEHLPAHDIYVDYIRTVHAADGTTFSLVPARDTNPFDPQPKSCIKRLHRSLLRRLHHESAAVRRRVLSFYRRTLDAERRHARQGPKEGVYIFERSDHGFGGGGGAGARELHEHGMFFTFGTSARRAHVGGLVPDGVATVTSTFGRAHRADPADPRDRKGDYLSVITRTDPVKDNVVSFTVARAAQDAFARKMVWRDANGAIVRVVVEPR
jgi:hypothetical protein